MNIYHTERKHSENLTKAYSFSPCLERADTNSGMYQPVSSPLVATFGLILSPIILLLNILVIAAIKRRKGLQKNTYIVLSSMAISDLLIGIVMLLVWGITSIVLVSKKISFERICVVIVAPVSTLITCMLFCSLYHLATIAWERYVAILKWKDYKVIVTKNRLKYLTVTSWTAAVVTGFVGTAMERGIKVKSTEVNFVIIFRIVIVLSTSIGIVYCYVAIYVSIRRHKTMRASRPMNQVVQAKLQTRVAKTCLLITVSLLATSILPGVISIFRFILPAFPKRFPFKVMGIVLQLNSIFNPLIYCYRDRPLRRAVLGLLKAKKSHIIYPNRRSSPYSMGMLKQREAKFQENHSRSRVIRTLSWSELPLGRSNVVLKRTTSCPDFIN